MKGLYWLMIPIQLCLKISSVWSDQVSSSEDTFFALTSVASVTIPSNWPAASNRFRSRSSLPRRSTDSMS